MIDDLIPEPVQRIVNDLQAGADDPMWADHCELPKRVAGDAATLLRQHAVEIERLRELVVWSATDAATAWEVCASIHRRYAKPGARGKDAFYTTRQEDYMRAARVARALVRTLESEEK